MKSMKDLKRFSKEWWQNLWFYYKWHFIIGTIAVAVITTTVISTINQVKPDIYILFCGDFRLTDEDEQLLKERVEATITDVNGDGRIVANFIQLRVTDQLNESTVANNTQMKNQFFTGEQHIYVMDREIYNVYNAQGLLDPEKLFEETATNPLFEGTALANRNAVMVTRVNRHDYESDFTTSQQMIDRWATK